MAQNRKYRAYGILRKNNLADLRDKEASLNNLLNNLPGVDGVDISFISQDLDAIRGLKETDITPDDFIQLAGTTPYSPRVDSNGVPVVDTAGDLISDPVNPLVRLEDRFALYRKITEDPPVFASGRGPTAYFIPSSLLPAPFPKGSNIDTQLVPNLLDQRVQVSQDFWVLGEFYINDRIRTNFPDEYGGIMWEGYYIPNPSTTIHTFTYETSGLFHVEFDRFGNGNWQVLKSIYAKLRPVLVQTAATNVTTITLQAGETVYVSIGDFLSTDIDAVITAISGNTITLSKAITVTAGQTLTFDMDIGISNVSGTYAINEILDRAETPQMKKRIFWWFPNSGNYIPIYKYLRNRIVGLNTYDYFYLNNERADVTAAEGSMRELLDNAITPTQDIFDYKFKSSQQTTTLYTPKPFLNQIVKGTSNITFGQGTRSANGTFSTTELGNYIVPNAVADLGIVIPKDARLKDTIGGDPAATSRLVNVTWSVGRTNYPVTFVDHYGLVDYYVVTSVGNVVNILLSSGTTSSLKTNMFCVYNNVNQFVRITEIISPTSFRTSVNLGLTNSYVYIYSNAGVVDTSLNQFCIGVFGQTMAAQTVFGSPTANILQLTSAVGILPGMVVQFGSSISSTTIVSSVVGNQVTLSENILATINEDETIVFAPIGTNVNKEICVLPLDLSPPFVGIDTGLDSNDRSIRSSQPSFNVKVTALTLNTTVTTTAASESYNGRIDLFNSNLGIIATRVV
jgi:hypothetical protein